jgi:hypothetical protein
MWYKSRFCDKTKDGEIVGEGFQYYLLIIGNPFAFTVKSIDE